MFFLFRCSAPLVMQIYKLVANYIRNIKLGYEVFRGVNCSHPPESAQRQGLEW